MAIRDFIKKLKLSEKDIIVYKNVLAAFMIKGLALLISLFMMPAYMRFFENQTVLGVWYTILSVLSWILNFDLGIGNGLRNKLSEALAQENETAARGYISSAYWMVGKTVLLFLAIGLLLIPLCNWNLVFNISPELISGDAMNYAVICAFISVIVQFFLRLISSVIYAMQLSALNDLLTLAISILQLLFLMVAPDGSAEENLRMFSAAYIFLSNIPLLVATVVIYGKKMKRYAPSYRFVDKEKSKSVLSLGGVFFACQLLYMFIANTNDFFITQYTCPDDVVEYQIYNRLFTLGSMAFGLALTPIWSVVSKAIAENDMAWLKKLYQRLQYLSWAAIGCEIALIFVLQPLINIWLKEEAIQVNYVYAAVFALFGSVMIYLGMVSTITSGMGKMKLQAICYAVGTVLKFIIIHIGISITGSWIVVVFANAIVLLPYCVIQKIALDRAIKY